MNKRDDWKKGQYSIAVKVYTPNGTVIELECPKIRKSAGCAAYKAVMGALGMSRLVKRSD